MENPTPNKSGGINLTAVIIAVILCAAGLGALFILKEKPVVGNASA